jgi:hypothetical protein
MWNQLTFEAVLLGRREYDENGLLIMWEVSMGGSHNSIIITNFV